MKRVIAVILLVASLLGVFSGCSDGHFRFEDENSVTRIAWIDMLAQSFGLDEYTSSKPYFSDVTESDEAFTSVQASYEWGVLSNLSGALDKDGAANLEFVVSTAVFAIGSDISGYEGKNDVKKALDYAVKNGIVDSSTDFNDWATADACVTILSNAQFAYLNEKIEPVEYTVINDQVTDLREEDNISRVSDDEYVISEMVPQVGDVLIAPATKDDTNGVAIKVESVSDNGDGTYTVQTVTPELHEVFDEVEYADVVVPELEDIVPSDGVTIVTSGAGNVSGGEGSYGVKLLSSSGKSNANVTPVASDKTGLSFTVSVNFTKGTVGFTPAFGEASATMSQLLTGENAGTASPGLGELFNKTSVFPDKTLFGKDAYSNEQAIQEYKDGIISAEQLKEELSKYQNADGTEKVPNITNMFKGGYEVTGTVSIKDLYLVPELKLKTQKILGVDTGIPTGIEKFTLETNCAVELGLSLKGSITEELSICSVPVSIGGIGTVEVKLILYMEVNGELAIRAEVSNNCKTEFKNGKSKKTTTKDASLSVAVSASFEAGTGIQAMIKIAGIKIIDVKVTAGILIEGSVGISLDTTYTETDEALEIHRSTTFKYGIKGYAPIVKLSIGYDNKTLANKLNFKFKVNIIGKKQAASFDILPEKTYILWEDAETIAKRPEDIQGSQSGTTDETTGSSGSGSSGVSISSFYLNLNVGDTETIDITYPDGYSEADFTWTTSDSAVVTVSNGIVKAVSSGSATITAKSKDGKQVAVCAVYVSDSE